MAGPLILDLRVEQTSPATRIGLGPAGRAATSVVLVGAVVGLGVFAVKAAHSASSWVVASALGHGEAVATVGGIAALIWVLAAVGIGYLMAVLGVDGERTLRKVVTVAFTVVTAWACIGVLTLAAGHCMGRLWPVSLWLLPLVPAAILAAAYWQAHAAQRRG